MNLMNNKLREIYPIFIPDKIYEFLQISKEHNREITYKSNKYT